MEVAPLKYPDAHQEHKVTREEERGERPKELEQRSRGRKKDPGRRNNNGSKKRRSGSDSHEGHMCRDCLIKSMILEHGSRFLQLGYENGGQVAEFANEWSIVIPERNTAAQAVTSDDVRAIHEQCRESRRRVLARVFRSLWGISSSHWPNTALK
ncbi:hypothetical protein HOY80DRAFT_1034610 [Tuber brumale]|nr:hypothetical protein HOY80DRAFT_1034610 [Tuber brumale]